METTKTGNIKIRIKPDRYYQGQFVGYKYYRLADVRRKFSNVDDFAQIEDDAYDLGDGAPNAQMIQHHIQPYRRVGYIVT